jgi:hypothetical protein
MRLTVSIPLVLGWDGTGQLKWSVDASFAVHKDMHSHTGAVLTLGQGALISMSLKQKTNTKSSTEADDVMNFVEWIQLFVEQQIKSINDDSILEKIGCDVVIYNKTTQVQYSWKITDKLLVPKNKAYQYQILLHIQQDQKWSSTCYIPSNEANGIRLFN